MKAQAYELTALPQRNRPRSVDQFNLLSVIDTDLVRLDFSSNGDIAESEVDEETYIARYNALHEANAAFFESLNKRFYNELLHHRELVGQSPVLARPPVLAEPDDVDELHLDPPAGRGHSHERALVRPGHDHARHDLVAAPHHVFRHHAQVRERGEEHAEVLEDAGLGRREAGQLFALDEIVGELVAEAVDISGVYEVVEAPHRGRVVHVPSGAHMVSVGACQWKDYAELLPSRFIPHRHRPRAELQPAHDLQVDPLR